MQYTPTLVISMSVYSPGILNSGAESRDSTSFSSSSAPRMAIILSTGKGAGPSSFCAIWNTKLNRMEEIGSKLLTYFCRCTRLCFPFSLHHPSPPFLLINSPSKHPQVRFRRIHRCQKWSYHDKFGHSWKRMNAIMGRKRWMNHWLLPIASLSAWHWKQVIGRFIHKSPICRICLSW